MKHRNLRRYFKHGTLTQLSVFEAVARLRSFTRAAEELHMAQPTVSVQVKKLSETIGLPLFEIIGRRVHMTEAGRELYAAVQDIFGKIGEVEHRLAGMRSASAGTLRIAVTTTGKYFAPRLLAQFVERYPGIEISLNVLNRQSLLNRLAGNLDDFYIFSNPPEDIDVAMHTLLPNPIEVYARSDHPLASRRGIPFREVAAEPFLMREAGSGTRMVAESMFAQHHMKPRIRMELGSNEAIKQGIVGGLGSSRWTSKASRSSAGGTWCTPRASSSPPPARRFSSTSASRKCSHRSASRRPECFGRRRGPGRAAFAASGAPGPSRTRPWARAAPPRRAACRSGRTSRPRPGTAPGRP